jgi:hypothetical protein
MPAVMDTAKLAICSCQDFMKGRKSFVHSIHFTIVIFCL